MILEKVLKKEKISIFYDYNLARDYFKNPKVIDSNKIKIQKLKIDKEGLKSFLKKFGYNEQYITKFISQINYTRSRIHL